MGSKKNTSAPVHTSGNRKDGYKNTQNGKQIGGTFDKRILPKKPVDKRLSTVRLNMSSIKMMDRFRKRIATVMTLKNRKGNAK